MLENMSEIISKAKISDFNNPFELHAILSKLNLRIYCTTNYDHIMFEAINNYDKNPILESCKWNDLSQLQGTDSIFD